MSDVIAYGRGLRYFLLSHPKKIPKIPDANNIFVSTVNPVAVLHINPSGKFATAVVLGDLFPAVKGMYRPRIKMAALGSGEFQGCLLLHEELVKVLCN